MDLSAWIIVLLCKLPTPTFTGSISYDRSILCFIVNYKPSEPVCQALIEFFRELCGMLI